MGLVVEIGEFISKVVHTRFIKTRYQSFHQLNIVANSVILAKNTMS